jgi:hypothetical protein
MTENYVGRSFNSYQITSSLGERTFLVGGPSGIGKSHCAVIKLLEWTLVAVPKVKTLLSQN